MGRPAAVTEVAVIECEQYKLTDPAPVDPSQSEYAVAPTEAVQLKFTEVPVSTEPGTGAVSVLCPKRPVDRLQSKSRVMRIRQEI